MSWSIPGGRAAAAAGIARGLSVLGLKSLGSGVGAVLLPFWGGGSAEIFVLIGPLVQSGSVSPHSLLIFQKLKASVYGGSGQFSLDHGPLWDLAPVPSPATS